ncbi:MAG: preprotein translocase subunit SecY [Euryarchaeota archaeon]|nr:preprotein translocase subunit SecY [Euryarchaeota archaeon]
MAERKSRLYILKPLIEKWPAVTKPEGHVQFKTKVFWTTLCLVIYFALTNVLLYGVEQTRLDLFANFRAILAGASGSVMHLGIGPIVTGSIIMQLFTGAKIINLDLTNSDDKAIYQGTQKILVIGMILIESVPQVFGYLIPDVDLIADIGMGGARSIIIAQLFMGALIAFLMDELISKWGIGSGISLFIAAGVAQSLFTGSLNWQGANTAYSPTDYTVDPNAAQGPNVPAGTIPMAIYVFTQSSVADLVHQGGFENVFIGNQFFPNPMVAFVGTFVIFLFVVYAESSRIELPLAHGKVRGARGRYPIRLIYASNIPVILIAALLANVNLFTILLYTHPTLSQIPVIGEAWWIGYYPPAQGGTLSPQPIAGGAWYLTTINGFQEWFLPLVDFDRYGGILNGHNLGQLLIRIAIYLFVFIAGSILFAKFWIETTNMGPEAVAKQIQSSGMQIPGFRRDPRVLQRILARYIPTVTVIGGATVGALAAFADMLGTVGQASGTGVLLAVGITIRMYEQIAKEQAMEMHPVLRSFFGAD